MGSRQSCYSLRCSEYGTFLLNFLFCSSSWANSYANSKNLSVWSYREALVCQIGICRQGSGEESGHFIQVSPELQSLEKSLFGRSQDSAVIDISTERDAGSVGFLHLLFFHVFSLFSRLFLFVFFGFHRFSRGFLVSQAPWSKNSKKTKKKPKKNNPVRRILGKSIFLFFLVYLVFLEVFAVPSPTVQKLEENQKNQKTKKTNPVRRILSKSIQDCFFWFICFFSRFLLSQAQLSKNSRKTKKTKKTNPVRRILGKSIQDWFFLVYLVFLKVFAVPSPTDQKLEENQKNQKNQKNQSCEKNLG